MLNKKLIYCVSTFALSMLPLHYMPPIYANAQFMRHLVLNIDIRYYMFAFIFGFILSGIAILYKKNSINKLGQKNVICLFYIASIFAIVSSGCIGIFFRFIMGYLSCCLFSRVYFVIYYSGEDKILNIGKMLGIASIILESLGFISGIVSNTSNTLFIISSYIVLFGLVSLTSLLSSKDVRYKPNVALNSNFDLKTNCRALINVIPSILAFTAFFLFIITIGDTANTFILPFYIGFSLLLLAIAFPFGTIAASNVQKILGYNLALIFFAAFPLVGVFLQMMGIYKLSWITLAIGTCLMAIGNGGIITINSAKSLIDSEDDLSRPPLLYMIISMLISFILGILSFAFTNKMMISMATMLLYITIMIYAIIASKIKGTIEDASKRYYPL